VKCVLDMFLAPDNNVEDLKLPEGHSSFNQGGRRLGSDTFCGLIVY
jgi:hypothetical protein